MVRIPMSYFSEQCVAISMMIIALMLVSNTILGVYWLLKLNKDDEEYLKTKYYVESIVLLSIPIVLVSFFVIVIIVALVILFFDSRRYFRRRRLEDDIEFEDEEMNDIPEIYMRMIEKITYKK